MFKILAFFLFLALARSALSCKVNDDCEEGEVCNKKRECVETEDDKDETTTTEKEEEEDEDTDSEGKKGKDCSSHSKCFSKANQMLECKAKKCVKSDWMLCESKDDCKGNKTTKMICFNSQCVNTNADKCPNDEYCKHINKNKNKNKECQNGKCVLSNRHADKEEDKMLSKDEEGEDKKGSKDKKTECKFDSQCTIEGVIQKCVKGKCVEKDKGKDKSKNKKDDEDDKGIECFEDRGSPLVHLKGEKCCVEYGKKCGTKAITESKKGRATCPGNKMFHSQYCGPVSDKHSCDTDDDCKDTKIHKKCKDGLCHGEFKLLLKMPG